MKTLLLVEDSRDDEELCVLALGEAGIGARIEVARDGVEALAVLADRVPDLVLLDVKMPRLGGFEVLRRMRSEERTRLVPVVMLSSSDLPDDVQQAYQLGANGYVKKPVDFEAYREAMMRVGRFWLELNEPPVSGAGRDP